MFSIPCNVPTTTAAALCSWIAASMDIDTRRLRLMKNSRRLNAGSTVRLCELESMALRMIEDLSFLRLDATDIDRK
jgi:hypothetical protein